MSIARSGLVFGYDDELVFDNRRRGLQDVHELVAVQRDASIASSNFRRSCWVRTPVNGELWRSSRASTVSALIARRIAGRGFRKRSFHRAAQYGSRPPPRSQRRSCREAR